MGVRFRGQIQTTHTNTNYTVELWDTTYTSTGVTNITLFGEGFQITYEGQGDEIYAPIKGSSCKVFAGITNDAAGLALRSWIYNSVLATKEDQYHVAIYESGNLYWFGVILPSLGNEPDESRPYDFIIQATDGIGRLKDKEFTLAVDSYTTPSIGRKTFIELIYEVLKSTPQYMATTEPLLFSTAVGYYEDTMPAKADDIDPLAYSKIKASAFAILEENKEPEGKSYYEVLAEICESWGMRMVYSRGLYRFYQVQSYSDDGVQRWERYYLRSDGQFLGSSSFDGYQENLESVNPVPSVVNGNQWEFYDPLKYVFLKFPFGVNSNLLDELETMPIISGRYTYQTDLRDYLVGGSARKLNFVTSLRLVISNSILLNPALRLSGFSAIVRVKLKLGSNYLLKPATSTIATWSTNPASTFDIRFDKIFVYEKIINIAFQTPDMPIGATTSNEFSISLELINPNNNFSYSTSQYTTNRQLGSTSLIYNSSANSENESYFEYIGGNTNTPINSYDIELPDTLIGESLDFGAGHIFVSANGVIYQPSSAKWRVEDTGSAYDFCMIRVRDVLTSQTIATRKYQGAILGSMIYGHSSLRYDGKIYIINGSVYNAMNERWDGEWIEVDYARASWQEIQGAVNQAGEGGDTQLRREIGDINYRDNLGNLILNSFVKQQEISVLTTDTTGTFSSINVGTLSYEAREGDYIRILTPDGGGNEVFRVTADSTGTSVSIDTATTTGGLPEGSVVFYDLADIIYQVRLGNIKVKTFSDDVYLEPFSQNVIMDADAKTIYLPDVSESFINGKSIEITIKVAVTSGGTPETTIDGNGANIDVAGTDSIIVKNIHAVTLFTNGVMWYIKNSFKHS